MIKKKYITFVSAVALLGTPQLSSAITLEASLEKVAAKVDTDGTYLQLNKIDGDIEKISEYGEIFLDLLRIENPQIPPGLKIDKLIKVLGINDLQAIAASAKKVDGAWNNKSYIYTGGSEKGIWSIYGGTDEKDAVTAFAPESTDIALQVRLNLSQMKGIITELAQAMGMGQMVDLQMNNKIPDLGGMTPAELIEKLNIRASVAIDIDRQKRMSMPNGFDAPEDRKSTRLNSSH